MAAFIGALSGLLIGPTTTVFYDSGFLIGLKGFVAAVFAGLSSYPLALVGAWAWACWRLRLVLGQRLQGGDRLRLHPAGAAVALAARPAQRRALTWPRRAQMVLSRCLQR
jgi:branched-subunit amino acid ABC-type transport system permease component